MKRNYYRIAFERYFSTPVPYFLLGAVPLMVYGYYENDFCFWTGMVLTVGLLVLNHFLMYSLTNTFGLYATKKQVEYVTNFVSGGSKVFSKQESEQLLEMMANQMGNNRICIDDYINYINHLLEEKANNGSAEAIYWLGIYHRLLGEAENHNSVARELIEKSANMGFERAKKLQERAKKWA
ncbi:MAG: hypothetical protein IJR02_15340 [Bacteroidaceae bacterium]|nr:hypothetical protein [Bacteroidaceae bacterium]MBQ6752118.1 hypothetical protein [Bacteroidaceae bacterium]